MLILKRLRQSELGWFKACRLLGRETGRQRGLNLDAALVARVFAPEADARVLQLRTRWHDGQDIVEDRRPLRRQQKNWRLTGTAVTGERFGTAQPDDIFILSVDTADGEPVVNWDLVSQNDHTTWSLFELARRELRGASAALVEGPTAVRLSRVAQRRLRAFGGTGVADTAGLSDEDFEVVVDRLADVPEPILRRLRQSGVGDSSADVLELLGGTSSTAGSRRELACAVIRLFGADLLADEERRGSLAAALAPQANAPDRWVRGGRTTTAFVRALGLPDCMAGVAVVTPAAHEDVEAWGPLGGLHDYQLDVATGIDSILRGGTWEKRRGVVWLPTGTGKTRVTVETLLMKAALEPPRNCILWVADRQELCEQAVETFRHVWMVQGRDSRSGRGGAVPTLRVQRLWGGRPWQDPPTWPTVIVASIQTLASRLDDEAFEEELAVLGERSAAVVFDEAHHVVAPSYSRVINALGLGRPRNYLGRNRKTAPPMLGLTATPARSSEDETEALSRRFQGRLVEPGLEYRSLAGFQDRGFLARLAATAVPTGWTLKLTRKEAAQAALFQALPSSVLRRAGEDARRTASIVRDLEARLGDLRSILVFACSVEHARTIAEVLSRRGWRAASVDGNTGRAERWHTIQRFRDGGLQVLVNCDLLATGFDAPNVDAVAIARPVGSRVLLSQMVGRGLRGPRNGGTERCQLIDYQDNIEGVAELEALRAGFRAEFLTDDA